MTSFALSSLECIPWVVFLTTEYLAIVIFNIVTIIVFVKQRQLQRRRTRSTYLIIHLAVVDLLVGAVSGTVIIEWDMRNFCDLWNYNLNITWLTVLKSSLRSLFPLTSLVNLAVIALERMHATFRPFRHRFMKKWVYGIMIAVIWLITLSRELVEVVLQYGTQSLDFKFVNVENHSPLFSFFTIFLFVFSVCYISIFIKVRCIPHPQHHGAANRERKLTTTLLFVTLVSIFCWLPFVISGSLLINQNNLTLNLSLRQFFHIRITMLTLVGANSLANPIVYAFEDAGVQSRYSKIVL